VRPNPQVQPTGRRLQGPDREQPAVRGQRSDMRSYLLSGIAALTAVGPSMTAFGLPVWAGR